jgi:hypothetical protein
VTIHGTAGSVFVDRSGSALYDLRDEVVRESHGRMAGGAAAMER